MNRGFLSNFFKSVAIKTLSEVDANPKKSNQHEVGTTKLMRKFMGGSERKFEATYIWLGAEQESITEYGEATFYDSRHLDMKRSAEWRLYYLTNAVTKIMSAGDTLILALLPNESLLFIIVEADSNIENQLLWLFDTPKQEKLFSRNYDSEPQGELDFVAKYLLDEIGIQYEYPQANTIDAIIEKYDLTFPKTAEFSALARATLPEVDPKGYPDLALVAWLNHEEAMFRRMEKKIVSSRIEQGFMEEGEADVDAFIKFSLSVQNRRKSRMGHSLENHLSALFDIHKISYSSQVKTEKGKKPDYIFPGRDEYFNSSFDVSRLTMLAAKSSCKDRWSQVLPEAERIEQKHLLTLEPAISESTTDTMRASSLQLVVPAEIQGSYKEQQQDWLWNVEDFLNLVWERQQVLSA